MEFRLDELYFEMIEKDKKFVEVRLNDEKRQELHVGDELTFSKRGNLDQKIHTKVIGLSYYKSFEDMLMYETKADIGFPNKTIEEIVAIYEEFYPKSEQDQYGVVAIRFQKV